MRDILQSRYLRSNVAHKQLARTSLNDVCGINFFAIVATCLFPVKTDKKEDRRKREIKEQERRVIVSFMFVFYFL